MLTGTRLEDDLDDLLWSFVNLFHRKLDRIERELDSNEQAQRRGQAEQDGSEVKSVELERLINQGISLIERRNAFEFARDHAAELYEAATGSAWRPHTGSMVNHRALTAAVIDSREFLAARRRADAPTRKCWHPPAPASPSPAASTATITPASGRYSTRSAPSTPTWCCCTAAARAAPSASPPAGPTIAKFPQVVFKPDWTRDRNAAPVQAQRPDARGAADRRRRVPRLRHRRQPRRQGQEARHPDLALRPAGSATQVNRGRAPGRRRLGADPHPRKPSAPRLSIAGAVGGSRLTTSRRSSIGGIPREPPSPACRRHWIISSGSRTHRFVR